jgi:hypothetical protein
VKLNENGSFTIELPQVSTDSEPPTQVQKTFSFSHPVNDIVLGIGQVAHPQYIQQQAKLWLLINIETFDTIESFETHQSSQYGTYFGNSDDNNFYAVQGSNGRKKRSTVPNRSIPLVRKQMKKQANSGCQSTTDSFTIQLQNYHYDLYGRGGDDRFFLGPQSSWVTGGDDNDFYHIPANGGKAIINNFAHDEEMDTLFLNVSYSDIFCARENLDLVVGYCQSHVVKTKNWFSHGLEEFHRHIYITTADGVVVEVIKSDLKLNYYSTLCAAISVDKFRSSSPWRISVTNRKPLPR